MVQENFSGVTQTSCEFGTIIFVVQFRERETYVMAFFNYKLWPLTVSYKLYPAQYKYSHECFLCAVLKLFLTSYESSMCAIV